MGVTSKSLVAIAAFAMSVAPALTSGPATAAPPPKAIGECNSGQLATGLVPGTGSSGRNIAIAGNLLGCNGRQLHGITAGSIYLTYPAALMADQNPATGTITWNNGQVSQVSGNWADAPTGIDSTNTLRITGGPGMGHGFQVVSKQQGDITALLAGNGSLAVSRAQLVP